MSKNEIDVKRIINAGNSVYIEEGVTVEDGATLLPFTVLRGGAVIRSGATVSASEIVGGEVESGANVSHSFLQNSKIESGAAVTHSHVFDSTVKTEATVGPFSRLRGSTVGAGARVGDFVEIKGSEFGDGAKAAHLTYVGDAVVGARTNLGCGTVFCNYDGKHKHKTAVGEDCFIGANVNIVAPRNVGNRAFIAAGTTVTADVSDDEFCIGRSRQTTKPRKD